MTPAPVAAPGPRVLLDATAVPADRGGVGRYVDELCAALDAEGTDLVVVCQQRDLALLRQRLPHAELHAVPRACERRPVRLLWEQVGLPLLARRVGADVVHAPHYTLPLLSRRPVVVTLHDATFFSDPGVHSRVKLRFFRTWIRLAARRAAALVTPSQATADEVVRHVGADPARITVAHLGVDTAVFRPPAPQEVRDLAQRFGLEAGWVAFLGTIEPRKNVGGLVRGWVAACRERPDPPALLLVGGAGWDTEVDAAIAAVPPELTLVRAGYLPLAELPAALGGATVVAYPSRGEGFGIPVLEGMACGAPVLTTRALALPEVGGDAVAYTTTDPDAIARDLAALLDDPQRRAELAARGLRRSATFTWRAAALTHLEVYRQVVGARSR